MRALLKGNIAFSAKFFKFYVKNENPLTEVNGFLEATLKMEPVKKPDFLIIFRNNNENITPAISLNRQI